MKGRGREGVMREKAVRASERVCVYKCVRETEIEKKREKER